MTIAEHTAGPWRYIGREAAIRGADGGYIASLGARSSEVALREDARRIVVCVNALEGYPTSMLEKAGAAGLFSVGVAIKEVEILRERERELVAALSYYADPDTWLSFEGGALTEPYAIARSAIAKVPI